MTPRQGYKKPVQVLSDKLAHSQEMLGFVLLDTQPHSALGQLTGQDQKVNPWEIIRSVKVPRVTSFKFGLQQDKQPRVIMA